MSTKFEELISPVDRERFFKDFFEKKHLLVRGGSKTKFHNILKERDIDHVLSSQRLTLPNARMANKNGEIEAKDLVLENTKVMDVSKVIELYAEGATLILSQLQDKLASLKELCDTLSSDFGQRFQTNIYCTPGNASQGFNIHHDTHDVFILQIEGQKKWHIYESPIELAVKDQTFIPGEHLHGDIKDEFILNAGDLLYIPRGLMHAAQTLDEKSIHITVGFMGYTWQDVFQDQLNILTQNDKNLRRGFQPKYWKNSEDYQETLDQIIASLQKPDFIVNALNQLHLKFINRHSTVIQNPLKQAEGVSTINLETLLFSKNNGLFKVNVENEDSIVISLYNKDIELPKDYLPIIQFIRATPLFKVKELPLLEDESQIEFSKTLIKSGLLHINFDRQS